MENNFTQKKISERCTIKTENCYCSFEATTSRLELPVKKKRWIKTGNVVEQQKYQVESEKSENDIENVFYFSYKKLFDILRNILICFLR